MAKSSILSLAADDPLGADTLAAVLPEGWSERASELGTQALVMLDQGGWAMMAIAGIALVMFGMGVHVLFTLGRRRFSKPRERVWRRWLEDPEQGRGRVARLLRLAALCESSEQVQDLFSRARRSSFDGAARDLKVMKVCVSAAPLVGLLGTVAGMLTTFDGLAGGGGDKTIGVVSGGISEALVTTMTGLVIALPGLFAHALLVGKLRSERVALSKLESAVMQNFLRRAMDARALRDVMSEIVLERQTRLADAGGESGLGGSAGRRI